MDSLARGGSKQEIDDDVEIEVIEYTLPITPRGTEEIEEAPRIAEAPVVAVKADPKESAPPPDIKSPTGAIANQVSCPVKLCFGTFL